MFDLISRNEVNDIIDKLEVYTSGRPNTMKVEISVLQLQRFINKLKNIPTAYDVDKVVKELEQKKTKLLSYARDYEKIGNFEQAEIYSQIASEYTTAIEIVKQGGVSDASDNVCEWKKYPFDWFTGCDGYKIHNKQGNYCPRCGRKIEVVK